MEADPDVRRKACEAHEARNRLRAYYFEAQSILLQAHGLIGHVLPIDQCVCELATKFAEYRRSYSELTAIGERLDGKR